MTFDTSIGDTPYALPVMIVSGFLGSGKTSLLNHLLANTINVRIGVVVNDFGELNIDAMLVTAQTDAMVSFGNGCLCCAADETTLLSLLDQLAKPGCELDAIVIEASGLAEPQNLVAMVLESRNPQIRYGGLIEVIDARQYRENVAKHPELARHVKLADAVVLNKTDVAGQDVVSAITAEIKTLNPSAPVITATYGEVAPQFFFEVQPSRYGQLSFADALKEEHRQEHAPHNHAHHQHLHHHYDSISFSGTRPMHPSRLMEFLDNRPEGVYRIKGFVNFDVPRYRHRYELQTVGKHVQFRRAPWPPEQSRQTQLVLIGTDLDHSGLERALRECEYDSAEKLDQFSMLGVIRFTVADQKKARSADLPPSSRS